MESVDIHILNSSRKTPSSQSLDEYLTKSLGAVTSASGDVTCDGAFGPSMTEVRLLCFLQACVRSPSLSQRPRTKAFSVAFLVVQTSQSSTSAGLGSNGAQAPNCVMYFPGPPFPYLYGLHKCKGFMGSSGSRIRHSQSH